MKIIFNLFFGLLFSSALLAQEPYYVLFDSDKALVPDTAMAFLIKTIYTHNVSAVYLEGHCDSIGSKQYNYGLSERRVRAVKQLLVDNGFDQKKIKGIIGFGKDKPRTQNETASDRQINRRVLVKFTFDKDMPEKQNSVKLTEKIEEPKKNIVSNKNAQQKTSSKQLKPAEQPMPLALENFKPNARIALPNLFFQGGRHFLMEASNSSLDSLVKILKKATTIRIEIQGHVCCTTYQEDGFDWDTQTHNLSETRALAIKSYLIKQGIAADRLETKGFGGNQKLFPLEENSYQIKSNRRVEVMVLP